MDHVRMIIVPTLYKFLPQVCLISKLRTNRLKNDTSNLNWCYIYFQKYRRKKSHCCNDFVLISFTMFHDLTLISFGYMTPILIFMVQNSPSIIGLIVHYFEYICFRLLRFNLKYLINSPRKIFKPTPKIKLLLS